MGEYTGRATRGIALDLTWGTLFLVITIIFLILGYYSGGYDPAILILIIFMGSLVVWLFYHLYFAIAPKKLVVNDIGIFLYSQNRLVKKIYWNEVRRVVSSSLSGKYPRVGFSVVGEGKRVININDRDVLGPEKTLRKAFLEITKIAAEKGIIIDDFLGWAPGMIGGVEEINLEELKGKWYKVDHITAKTWLEMSMGIVMVGGIIIALDSLLSFGYGDKILFIGITILSMGVLILVSGIYAAMYFPDEVYFDEYEIKMRSSIGKGTKVPWYKVKKVSCVEETGLTTICDIWNNCYSAKLDEKICKALKIAFKRHKG